MLSSLPSPNTWNAISPPLLHFQNALIMESHKLCTYLDIDSLYFYTEPNLCILKKTLVTSDTNNIMSCFERDPILSQLHLWSRGLSGFLSKAAPWRILDRSGKEQRPAHGTGHVEVWYVYLTLGGALLASLPDWSSPGTLALYKPANQTNAARQQAYFLKVNLMYLLWGRQHAHVTVTLEPLISCQQLVGRGAQVCLGAPSLPSWQRRELWYFA